MKINFEAERNLNNLSFQNQVNSSEKNIVNESMATSAFSLSIGNNDTVMPGTESEKVAAMGDFEAALSASDVQMKQDYMAVMSLSMSDKDYAELVRTGQVPEDMDATDAVTIIDDIKAQLLKAGTQVAGYTDDIDIAALEQITGSVVAATDLINAMNEQDVPISDGNVSSAVDAISKAMDVLPLADDAKQYLIENELPPTIDNVYMATHSKALNSTGYQSDVISQDDMRALMPQIEEIVHKSGIQNNEQALEEARWLVERGIPLNVENLYRADELTSLQEELSPSDISKSVAIAMGAGIPANKANLSYNESIYTQAEHYIEALEAIDDTTVDAVTEDGLELNIKNLTEASTSIEDGMSSEGIHARRVLEEVRISMTVQANRYLIRNNFYIDITPMEELVDALKKAEQSINNQLFPAEDKEVTASRAEIYAQTRAELPIIPTLPASILGQTDQSGRFIFESEQSFTLHQVYESGVTRKEAYVQAQVSYEAIMTSPRADLGDSIRKAFRNVDDILQDLNLDVNDDNQRAIRILGYNEIAITTENIELVRAADRSLRDTLDRLTPSRVLSMIREDVNPLNMSLSDLNEYLDNQDEDPQRQAENYARFLMQLERQDEITEMERESYIGIYRMITSLDKSDDAAVGRLMELGQTTSFANLLQAMRSMKHAPMDYSVDDQFGGVDSVRKTTAIDEQINSAYVEHMLNSGNQVSFSNLEAMEALRSERGDWFKPLKDKENENGSLVESAVDGLLDSMTDSEHTSQAYSQMLDTFSYNIKDMMMNSQSILDIKAMQSSMRQISILRSALRDETYDVPVTVNGESTSIRLTLRHESGAGQLFISMETQITGRVAAEFSLSGSASGYIVYEKEDARDALGSVVENMISELSFVPELVKVDRVNPDKYGMLMKSKPSEKDDSSIKKDESAADISNTELYRISKIFIGSIRKI